MIKLNLLDKKKKAQMPKFLGISLSQANIKFIVMSAVLFLLPGLAIDFMYTEKIQTIEATKNDLMAQNEQVRKEIEAQMEVKAQLDSYKAQVEKLEKRSAQVDEILKIKNNPKKVLEKIARSIPEDVWIDSLKINENHEILIQGGSYTARGIGEFITIANDSPYFGGTLTPTQQENRNAPLDGAPANYEYFELKGQIINYDMRGN